MPENVVPLLAPRRRAASRPNITERIWNKLKEWDKRTWRKFRADYSVEELEKRFDLEDEWQKAGKPLRTRAFFAALKEKLEN